MQWVKIFSSEEEAKHRLTGKSLQLLVLHEVRICLAQTNDTFHAVQDSCTHNGESLSKGHLNHMGEVICPWHNYCFNLQTGREFQSRSKDLKTYPIKIDETGFYIGI